MKYIWPVDSRVTQKFGSNPNPAYQPDGHTGMDFGCPIGTPVRAIADGVVLHENWASKLGWPNPYYIAIDFDGPSNGDQSAGIVLIVDHGEIASISAHLNSTIVNKGDRVKQGQIIGYTGNTGRSTGPHLHFEILPDAWNVHGRFYGRVNPELYCGKGPAVAANQRVTGGKANVNQRAAANTSSAVVRIIGAGKVEEFSGFVRGESVQGNDVWYKDAQGYAWSGGFNDSSTAGLPDLTPKAPAPAPVLAAHQRITGKDGVTARKSADKNAAAVSTFGGDLILDFKGYVHGSDPYGSGNDVWFVGAHSAVFIWSGGLEDPSTRGLVNLTAPSAPAPAPAPTPVVVAPEIAAYDFTLDFAKINGLDVEKVPAHSDNVDTGNFPAEPSHTIIHWWNAPALMPSISSVVNEFVRPASYKSAHFVVSGSRILQMVSLKDRAYHAGKGGNGWIGIEVDPRYDAATVANLKALLIALRGKYGYKFTLIRHKDVPGNATACNELDLDQIEIGAPVIVPAPVDPPVLLGDDNLEDFTAFLINLYRESKV